MLCSVRVLCCKVFKQTDFFKSVPWHFSVSLMCLFSCFFLSGERLKTQKQNSHSDILHTAKHHLLSFFPVLLLTLVPPGPACRLWIIFFLSTETLFVCEGQRGSEDRRHSGIVTACKTSFSCMYKQFCCTVAPSVWLLSDDGRCYCLQHWHLHLKPWVNVPVNQYQWKIAQMSLNWDAIGHVRPKKGQEQKLKLC